MSDLNHRDTWFHAHVIPMFEGVVHHIKSIPGDFKEQFVKYDDNPQDTTIIKFHPDDLKRVRDVVETSHDMIVEMYYQPNDCFYLKPGIYNRLMQKTSTEDQRKAVEETYKFLLDDQ